MLDLAPVTVRDPGVPELIDALTVELADGGYSETFGYSPCGSRPATSSTPR
jgi:hypothetical protein